jgi:hypothetical protein
VNVRALFDKFGKTPGKITRTSYNLTTGLPNTPIVARNLPISLQSRSQIEHGINMDSVPTREFMILVPKSALEEQNFPVPLKDGDFVEVAGVKASLRACAERVWGTEVVYECRVEGVNAA